MKIIILTLSMLMMLTVGCSSSTNHNPPQSESTSKVEQVKIPSIASQNLIIYSTPERYTYQNMMSDIQQLKNICGNTIKVVKLCNTADGRGVYDVVVGSGSNQILIFGAMHAREYITTQVVMRQLCAAIDAVNGYGDNYNNIPVQELLKDVTIHFIPMNNPDGVSISQLGLSGLVNATTQNKVAAMSNGDYEQWKANANGVDLNRNFDAGWNEYVGAGYPSSERYKGKFPGSEPEAAALINLTKQCNFKRTISYHTCGDLIYWYYKQQGIVLEQSKKFAQRISDETGYYLDSDYTAVDAAGYKDWAVYKMGIPSLTIEIGAENGYSLVNPVPISRFSNIWQRNQNVVYATVYNLKYDR